MRRHASFFFFFFFFFFVKKKKATWVFSPKKFQLCLKKILWAKYENKATKIGVENRAQHASQGHLYLLETDCNPASMPRREYQTSCVCVPPGGPPEGILDIAEHIECRVVFVLFLFWGPKFFRQKWNFLGEKTHVAKIFERWDFSQKVTLSIL